MSSVSALRRRVRQAGLQQVVPGDRRGYWQSCGDWIVSEPGALPPLRLDPVRESAAAARSYVRAALNVFGLPELVDSAELGVSELAGNACLHAHTSFIVAVTLTDTCRVRITVSDASDVAPMARPAGPLATSGRGLLLLTAAGEWGVERPIDGSSGKGIWFEPTSELTEAPRGIASLSDPFD